MNEADRLQFNIWSSKEFLGVCKEHKAKKTIKLIQKHITIMEKEWKRLKKQ